MCRLQAVLAEEQQGTLQLAKAMREAAGQQARADHSDVQIAHLRDALHVRAPRLPPTTRG
jgi:hypothetical protein